MEIGVECFWSNSLALLVLFLWASQNSPKSGSDAAGPWRSRPAPFLDWSCLSLIDLGIPFARGSSVGMYSPALNSSAVRLCFFFPGSL